MSDWQAYGSGNVFADMGLPNPEERLAKADIAIEIASVIEAKSISVENAAALAGIPVDRFEKILRGRLADISMSELEAVAAKFR